jgi:hypothetical protein
MVEIFLYLSYDSWYKEKPDASIKGKIVEKNATYLEMGILKY